MVLTFDAFGFHGLPPGPGGLSLINLTIRTIARMSEIWLTFPFLVAFRVLPDPSSWAEVSFRRSWDSLDLMVVLAEDSFVDSLKSFLEDLTFG